MLQKSCFFPFLTSLIIAVSLIGFAQATVTSSFWVKAGEDVSRSINLSVDDRVLIEFTTVWAAEANTIGFSIVFPNGTVTDYGEQGALSLSFVCTENGQYTLHFVNHDAETKLVTLESEIDHYIFGMTTSLFWLVLIALVCIVGAIVLVILTKT